MVPERNRGVDRVVIAASLSRTADSPTSLELGDDSEDPSLGNADLICNVAQSGRGVAGEANQHVRMVAEKRPRSLDPC
jgi:hypothetical protein